VKKYFFEISRSFINLDFSQLARVSILIPHLFLLPDLKKKIKKSPFVVRKGKNGIRTPGRVNDFMTSHKKVGPVKLCRVKILTQLGLIVEPSCIYYEPFFERGLLHLVHWNELE